MFTIAGIDVTIVLLALIYCTLFIPLRLLRRTCHSIRCTHITFSYFFSWYMLSGDSFVTLYDGSTLQSAFQRLFDLYTVRSRRRPSRTNNT